MQFNKTGSDQANEQADIAYAFAQKTTLATLTALTIIAILFAVYRYALKRAQILIGI